MLMTSALMRKPPNKLPKKYRVVTTRPQKEMRGGVPREVIVTTMLKKPQNQYDLIFSNNVE
jgi:hypothetical protein